MNNLPTLIESLRSNHGARSVTRAVFPSGATALMHYHTEYRETFSVIEGELTVIKNGKKHIVKSGQISPVIEIREVHTYRNDSRHNVVVDIILEPGHPGCEKANNIIAGLVRENKQGLLSPDKKYSIFWIAFYEITNTIPVGVPGIILFWRRIIYGRGKIDQLKQDWINTYSHQTTI